MGLVEDGMNAAKGAVGGLLKGNYPKTIMYHADIDNKGTTFWSADVNAFKKGTAHDYSRYSEPTYLGFKLLFDWYDSPLFKGLQGGSGGSGQPSYPADSAAGYLYRQNETIRLEYLQEFYNRLQYINQNQPWYWQGITGLDRLWQTYNNHFSTFAGGDDAKISIDCLESMDFAITGLLDLYRAATYDSKFVREIIPANLVKFNVTILIQDIRPFHSKTDFIKEKKADNTTPLLSGLDLAPRSHNVGSDNSDNPARRLMKNLTQYVIIAKKCEFNTMESTAFWENITNVRPEPTKQQLVFEYQVLEIDSAPLWYSSIITDHPMLKNGTPKDKIEGTIDKSKRKRFIQMDSGIHMPSNKYLRKGMAVINGAIDKVSGAIESGVTKFAKGLFGMSDNIYKGLHGIDVSKFKMNQVKIYQNITHGTFDLNEEPILKDGTASYIKSNTEPLLPVGTKSYNAVDKDNIFPNSINTNRPFKLSILPDGTESYKPADTDNIFSGKHLATNDNFNPMNIFQHRPISLNLGNIDILPDNTLNKDLIINKIVIFPDGTLNHGSINNENVYN